MTYQFQNASILVVDDMRPMLTLTSSLLEIIGFRNIYLAANAKEAFKLHVAHNPDIILTDWQVEPENGLDLVKKIRQSERGNRFVPIIMMTGYSHRLRVERARDYGVTEFLVKPFKAKDLYIRIEQLIEKPRNFVESGEFFGPDRRRRKVSDYDGPFKRDEDVDEESDDLTLHLLQQLRNEAEKTGK